MIKSTTDIPSETTSMRPSWNKICLCQSRVSNDCTLIVEQILQYLPDEALLELAAATNGHTFYTKYTISHFDKQILVVSRLKC